MSAAQPNQKPPFPTSIDDQPHAPPTDEEVVYFDGPPMFGGKPERVVGLSLLGLLAIVAPLIYRVVRHEWLPHAAVIACVVIAVILWIIAFFTVRSLRYRVSNYRIDYERGVMSKDISTIELWHVEDIAFHQSILDRILSIGTIRVMSHDQNMPNLLMRGLPNARKVFEELKQRIIAVKRQSGVMKLDTGT